MRITGTGEPPAISVLIAVYNRFEWLAAALASVRRQSVTDFEIIVADSSTLDGVGDYLSHLASLDSRITVVTSPTALSAPEGRNLALLHARAPLIALLDSDDVMRPGRLAQQVEVLRNNPEVVLVASEFRRIDQWGIPLPPVRPDERPPFPMRDLTVKWRLPFDTPLGPTSMIRAHDLRAIGGFDNSHPLSDDWSAAWQLSERGALRILPEALTDWRRYFRQSSAVHRRRALVEMHLLTSHIVYSRLGCWLGPTVPALGPDASSHLPADPEELLSELLDHALTHWSPSHEERNELERECEHLIAMSRRSTDSLPLEFSRLSATLSPAAWAPHEGHRAT
ncbi:MAG: glycosyltransferase family 2 protein [Actinomycetes bacterium]